MGVIPYWRLKKELWFLPQELDALQPTGGGSTQDGGEGWPTRLRLHREDQRVAARRAPSRVDILQEARRRKRIYAWNIARRAGWKVDMRPDPPAAGGQEREEDDQGLAGRDPPPKWVREGELALLLRELLFV